VVAANFAGSGADAVNIDGTDHTGLNSGTAALDGTIYLNNSSPYYMTGYVAEVGIWPSGFTSTNRAAIVGNAQAYGY
jgi:hypothetical protein